MQSVIKLGRKFVLLTLMVVGTSFAVLTDTNAAPAMPCCSDCDAIYQDCIDGGGTPAECFQLANRCYRRCSPSC